MKTIELTQGKVAIVDDEDFVRLSNFKWCIGRGYAVRTPRINGRQEIVQMHREILVMAKGNGKDCDHINGNKLDNRRDNLRECSRSENSMNQRIRSSNTSGFKCVHWHKQKQKWYSQITINGKHKCLGLFDLPELAHAEYQKAAIELHGEFANFGTRCIVLEQK